MAAPNGFELADSGEVQVDESAVDANVDSVRQARSVSARRRRSRCSTSDRASSGMESRRCAPVSSTSRWNDTVIRAAGPLSCCTGSPTAHGDTTTSVRLLVDTGHDVVVPYLRGYGGTRFVDDATMRSGQQAALGHDLRAMIEAMGPDRPVVVGYDWGGRAACVVAAVAGTRV